VAYVVLGISAIFDLVSLRQSAHQMTVQAHLANRSLLEEAAATSDPSLRGVFNEDAVSIAGDALALLGLGLSQVTGSSIPQAIAAVLIALVLIRISLRLVKRNHDFLLGQPIPAYDRAGSEAFFSIAPVSRPFANSWSRMSVQITSGFSPESISKRSLRVTK
jgi:divalent metal cation (Fe/Co/Zn/Cd) transporter